MKIVLFLGVFFFFCGAPQIFWSIQVPGESSQLRDPEIRGFCMEAVKSLVIS